MPSYRLVGTSVNVGLINSVDGTVDLNVNSIRLSTHVVVAEMITAIVAPGLK